MKNCRLCGYRRICNDLPFVCILLQYVAVAGLVGLVGYLFVTSEMMR